MSTSMSVNSNLLDSILNSSQSGMDLAKGVPGKNEELNQLKPGSKSFESHLEVQNAKPNAEKKIEAPAKEGSKTEHVHSAPTAKPAVQEKPGTHDADDDSDEENSDTGVAQVAVPVQDSSLNQIVTSVPNSADEELHKLAAEVSASAAETRLPVANTELPAKDVNLPAADIKLSGKDMNLSQADIQLSEPDLKLSETDISLSAELLKEKAPAESKMNSEMNSSANDAAVSLINSNPQIEKILSGLKVQSPTKKIETKLSSDQMPMEAVEGQILQGQESKGIELGVNEPEAPSKNLKHLVDGLFIQKNIQTPESSESIPMAMQFVKEVEQKFDLAAKSAVPELVRSHLANDMQPLVTKVLATNQGGEMSLSLRPANLGMVKIDIQVLQGSVKVDVQAEQPHAKNLLQSQMGELKQQLQQAGLKIDEIKISSMQSQRAEHSSNSDRDPQSAARREQNPSNQSSKRDSEQAREFVEQLIEGKEKNRRAA
jgi:hypothetical protein